MDEFDWIFDVLEAYDQYQPPELPSPFIADTNGAGAPRFGERVGDDFNARGNWREILEPKGWRVIGASGEKLLWKRPDKDERGWSATTGFCKNERSGDLLYIFSTNATPFEAERAYSKFSAYAILWCGADFSLAAKTLADAGWGTPLPSVTLAAATSTPQMPPQAARTDGIARIFASELRRVPQADKWLWKGLIPAEMATIFSALPKAGKTTLLSHLLLAIENDGNFCGQEVKRARVLYVTEESETIWAERRDKLGLKDHCEFVLRPFRLKPNLAQWNEFLKRFTDSVAAAPVELVVFDTLAKLWPVDNENDASEVTGALMPLLELCYGMRVTLLLVHHLRKTEGLESTGTRGSGGITAAVDSILELRRYNPKDRKDRRRLLHCDARYDDRLDELVIELSGDGLSYVTQGDRKDASTTDLVSWFLQNLPREEPGWTLVECKVQLDREDKVYSDKVIRSSLEHGAESGLWNQGGEGKKGSPSRYFRPL